MDLRDWLRDNFHVVQRRGVETQMECPKCGEPTLYFNTWKRVGYCQRASCGWTPRLKDLQDYATYAPIDDETGGVEEEAAEIALPDGFFPIVEQMTELGAKVRDMDAWEYLSLRGITIEQVHRYKLHSSLTRVLAPVYEGGKLVSYVSRHYRGADTPWKYLYPKGGRHARTFFGWDEARFWPRLSLVENTFVGLWLRKHHVTTNFGSHLTDDQINKIKLTPLESVVLVWDEWSGSRAEKATARLREAGIPAAYIALRGQPDNHPEGWLLKTIDEAHRRAGQGETWIQT